MKILIVGMGVQGKKRKKTIGKDFRYSVDKYKYSNFRSIYEVPLEEYDAAFVCLPGKEKLAVVKYCIYNKKHVLIEKPFTLKDAKTFLNLQKMARKNRVVCYTAYNHRFEPHIIKMKKMIKSQKLGKLYSCRIFYGNGTAKLVKDNWRDKGNGIVTDLAPHLIDMCLFWFGKNLKNFKIMSLRRFENKSPDHALLISEKSTPKIHLEMSYHMYRNDFVCELLASKGSAHINRLCKWGTSVFTYRKRKFPSGKPTQIKKSLLMSDPTWLLEYKYFKKLVRQKGKTSFSKDIWIQEQIK